MKKMLKNKKLLIAGVIVLAVLIGALVWWNRNRAVGRGTNGRGMGQGQEMTDEQRESMKEEMTQRMKEEGLTDGEIEQRLKQGPGGPQNGSGPMRVPVNQ